MPEVDLFASRLNTQVERFVSWTPEPGAWGVDAFSLHWDGLLFYAFPPFSVIGRVLMKVKQERTTGILVVPLWPTQPWFPSLLKLLVAHPQACKPGVKLQIKRQPLKVHPLHKKLVLLVTHISGRCSLTGAYQAQLQSSCQMPGKKALRTNTPHLFEHGDHFVQMEN
jgi:hypothetical protein